MTASDLSVLGIEVPVGSIDGELRKLWEADEASTNASLMNFAVYSEDPDSLAENSEIIRQLTREHACRAILIAMDRKAPEPEIHSWITAHCNLAHGQKSVCCEQLSFLLRGYAAGRLRNTVFSHLSSDLPLVFWWQGELSRVFENRLYGSIDRFIIDSANWADPREGFARIEEAVAETGDRLVVQDLAWTRTYHYRLAVAALFDGLVAQRCLGQLEKVVITARRSDRISAILLLAWLATQAKWNLVGTSGDSYQFESAEGATVEASCEWTDGGAPVSRCELAGPEFSLRVTREDGSNQLKQVLKCPEHTLERSGPADAFESAGLVADQLSRGGTNALYRKVWPALFALLEA